MPFMHSAPALPLHLPPEPTPMMAQYKGLKEAHPACLLFFRMGDFYELFFEDAVTAAPVLDVALTRRGRDGDEEIPMCGVPVHAIESYLPRLIRAGFHVAIAEQMEDPAEAKKRGGAKALVERQVIRVITQGTLTEESYLEAKASNFLAVLAEAGGVYALAWCDLAEGQPTAETAEASDVPALLARIQPAELVLSERLRRTGNFNEALEGMKERLSILPPSRFDAANARRVALQHYGVASLDAFGAFSPAATAALGVLIDYIKLTQKQEMRHLSPPRAAEASATLAIDTATRRNLELAQSLSGERKGSLLAAIDRSATHAGARLLAQRLSAPLRNLQAIEARLNEVDFFAGAAETRDRLRGILKELPDLPRALARVSLSRGSPRDLAAIKSALEGAARIRLLLNQLGPGVAPEIKALSLKIGEHSGLTEELSKALRAELPQLARDGGFVAPGYDAALDELISLRDDSKRLIAALQAKYAGQTKIPSLKIRHNNVLGFFIEVTPSHADKMLAPPLNAEFIHRQTLASSARFTTVELSALERKAMEAGSSALALELEIFGKLVQEVMARFEACRAAADAMAELDVASALAALAVEKNWCRPIIDNSLTFEIKKGRHPVVEEGLAAEGAAFVPNDCDLGESSRLWLVTGPNMAGKSTYLRQNALMTVLAQMGSYVPAESARMGLVDRLFSRVGAADDLARGRSTFMVEMVETAAILNQASEKSLVILDEIGRGTATFDGLSLASGCLEYLYHHNQSRGLFATHYLELTALAAQLPRMKCAKVAVREWEGEVIFLHEVKEGAADRSYGIHVARLAGLPEAVVTRAEAVLRELEKSRPATKTPVSSTTPGNNDFSSGIRKKSEAEKALAALEPDSLSPKEALEELYRLKGLIKN